jgi:hypothetical protein
MLSNVLKAATERTPTEEINYITSVSQENATSPIPTTTTFSGVSLGQEFSGRRIVLVVSTQVANDTTATQSSVTVDGVSATQRIQPVPAAGGTGTLRIGIYDIEKPYGATADISVTVNASGTLNSVIVHVYSLDSALKTIVTGEDGVSPYNFTRTYVLGDIYIGGIRLVSTATETWSNATENAETVISGRQRLSTATYYPAVSGSRTITVTPSNTVAAMMASVVYTE